MKHDYYSPVAEFYDLVGREYSAGETALRNKLADLRPIKNPIVDIGAGTGRSTLAIAEVVPDVEILAVEPAPAMRAVLMHRIAMDQDLRRRVTILSEDIDGLHLPDRLGAVVAFGVLGHLNKRERQRLWKKICPRLSPGSAIFVELLPVEKPSSLTDYPLAEETIGQQTYTATLEAVPGEGDEMHMTSTWTVKNGSRILRTIQNTSIWHTFGLADLAAETGLKAERMTEQAGVLYV